jgi:multidrug efflux system membrane fusion protein
MKKGKLFLSAAFVTILAASGGLIATVVASPEKDTAGTVQVPRTPVDVTAVQVRKIRHWDEFNGRISAVETVEVRPRVSGHITRVAYKEGDEIRKGDLLFVIDPRPYQAALNSARAKLEHARAATQLAKVRNERARRLLPSAAVSQDEADMRHAILGQSSADVQEAEAAVYAAKLNLEFTEVRAPIEGRAGRALFTVGNLAMADQSLLTMMVSQDPVYVDFDPDEQSYLRYTTDARRNQRNTLMVRVALAGDSDFAHLGQVDFLDNQIDSSTGSIRMRARLHNPGRTFTPGLFARVQVTSGEETNSILIDDKAVLTDQDRKFVYVLGAGNTAQRREVKLGRRSENLRVIESGLMSGDKVITGGTQKIYFSGAPVDPSEVPATVAAN